MDALIRPHHPVELAKTLLFVPANDRHKVAKAWSAGADAVILDLEDAVAPANKAAARSDLLAMLAARPDGVLALVRVNSLGTTDGQRDLAAIAGLRVDAVVVPKVDDRHGLEEVTGMGVPIVAMIETASGVLGAPEIAATEGVVRLMFGPVDLAADLGCALSIDGIGLMHARSHLVLASAAGGLAAPIDGPFIDFRDADGLRTETGRAQELGFGAKACIHPDQVEIVAGTLRPTARAVEHARRVIDAYEAARDDGFGVVALDGQMIDLPVVRRAYKLLEANRSPVGQ